MKSKSTTYVSMNGDFPNIGDAIIRRRAFDWVRDVGGSVVYTANAPDTWLDQIGVGEADTVIRGRDNFWAWARLVAAAPRRSMLLLEPGEVILDGKSLRKEAGLLALAVLTRLKGGRVILPPRAAVRPATLTLAAHKALCRLANIALWREQASLQTVGIGESSPDIAFSAGIRQGRDWPDRDVVIISLRGHRPAPSEKWIHAVREFADDAGLRIVTVSQVFSDEVRSAELAKQLGGEHFEWATEGDLAHESRLRELYDNARIAISDRLHVLIIASLSGVVPSELVDDPAPKVRTHFEQIGFAGASLDARDRTSAEMIAFLSAQSRRAAELNHRVVAADRELESIAHRIAEKNRAEIAAEVA